MNCEIRDEQDIISIDIKKIESLCDFLGKRFNRSSEEYISLFFVENSKIKEINREFLEHDFETDVISFPMEESNILGDIVVSTEQAMVQKDEYNTEEEVLFLIIHGFLHLLGYEDYEKDDRKDMIRLGKTLIKEFKEYYGE